MMPLHCCENCLKRCHFHPIHSALKFLLNVLLSLTCAELTCYYVPAWVTYHAVVCVNMSLYNFDFMPKAMETDVEMYLCMLWYLKAILSMAVWRTHTPGLLVK